jgi:hypothetical protein
MFVIFVIFVIFQVDYHGLTGDCVREAPNALRLWEVEASASIAGLPRLVPPAFLRRLKPVASCRSS